MARFFTYGFEGLDSTIDAASAANTDATTPFGVGVSFKCNSGTGSSNSTSAPATPAIVNNVSASYVWYTRFYARFDSFPTNSAYIFMRSLASLSGWTGVQPGLLINPSGQLFCAANTSSLSPALSVNTWYRIEVKTTHTVVASTSTTISFDEVRVNGVTQSGVSDTQTVNNASVFGGASLQRWEFGWNQYQSLSVGSNKNFWFDNICLNDTTDAAQTSWPGPGQIYLLLPTSDNGRGDSLWTGGAGGTTNLYDAVNNTPPVGLSSSTDTNLSQIKHAGGAANTTISWYKANMTTYTAAGIGATDKIRLVQAIGVDGEEVTTQTKNLQYSIISNPAVATSGSVKAGDDGATAIGTYPTGWAIHRGTISYDPSGIALGTAPVMQVLRPETASRVASVCFMGMIVETTPATTIEATGDGYLINNNFASLRDDFGDGVSATGAVYTPLTGGTAVNSGNKLQLSYANASPAGYSTWHANAYLGVSNALKVEYAQAATTIASTASFYIGIGAQSWGFQHTPSNGAFYAFDPIGGVVFVRSYSSATDRFLRIRWDASNVYLETSGDGQTWSSFKTYATTAVSGQQGDVFLSLNKANANAVNDTIYFDSLNAGVNQLTADGRVTTGLVTRTLEASADGYVVRANSTLDLASDGFVYQSYTRRPVVRRASIDGFETGALIVSGTPDAGLSVQSARVRSGNYALKVTATSLNRAAYNAILASSSSATQVYLRGYVYFDALPTSRRAIAGTNNFISSSQSYLLLNTDGTIAVANTDSSSVISVVGTSATALTTGAWYRIEWLVNPQNGKQSLRINGGPEVTSVATTRTTVPSALYVGACDTATGAFTCYWDDLAVDYLDWVGDSRIAGVVPTGAGTFSSANFTLTGAATKWQALADVPADDATSYVTTPLSTSSSDLETYTLSSLPGTATQIRAWMPSLRLRRTASATAATVSIGYAYRGLSSAGTGWNNFTTILAPSSGWSTVPTVSTGPQGPIATMTLAEWASMEVGIQPNSTTGQADISQLMVQVEYVEDADAAPNAARLYAEGFDRQPTDMLSFSGTCALSSTYTRSGGYAIRANPASAATAYAQISAYQRGFVSGLLYARVYVYVHQRPTSGNTTRLLHFGSAVYLGVRMNDQGQVRLEDSTGLLGSGYSSTAIPLDTWVRLELKLRASSTSTASDGTGELRLDGASLQTATSVKTGTAIDTAAKMLLTLGNDLGSGISAIDLSFDDLAVDGADWVGESIVTDLIPTGAGSLADGTWTPTGAATNWQALIDAPPDNATTYVTSPVGPIKSSLSFTLTQLPSSATAILQAGAVSRISGDGTSNGTCRFFLAGPAIRTNGVGNSFTASPNATAWTLYTPTLSSYPASGAASQCDGAWTPTLLNSAEGVLVEASNTVAFRTTLIRFPVEYVAGTTMYRETSADAYVGLGTTKTLECTAAGIVLAANETSETTGSGIVFQANKTLETTATGPVQTTNTTQSTGSGIVFVSSETSQVTASADLLATNMTQLTASADLLVQGETSQATASAIVFVASETSQTAASAITLVQNETSEATASGLMATTKTLEATGTAIVFAAAETSETSATSLVAQTRTQQLPSDADLFAADKTIAATADAFVQRSTTLDLAGSAILRWTTTQETFADGPVQTTRQTALTADVIAQATMTASASGDGLLAAATTKSLGADADLLAANKTSELAGSSIIKATKTSELAASSWVASVGSLDLLATGFVQDLAHPVVELSTDAQLILPAIDAVHEDFATAAAIDGSRLFTIGSCFGGGAVTIDQETGRLVAGGVSSQAIVQTPNDADLNFDITHRRAWLELAELTLFQSDPAADVFASLDLTFGQGAGLLDLQLVLESDSGIVHLWSYDPTNDWVDHGPYDPVGQRWISWSTLGASLVVETSPDSQRWTTLVDTGEADITAIGAFVVTLIVRDSIHGTSSALFRIDNWNVGTSELAADAIVAAQGTTNLPSDAALLETKNVDLVADALLQRTAQAELTVDAVVSAAGETSQTTASAIIFATNTNQIAASALVAGAKTQNLYSDAIIAPRVALVQRASSTNTTSGLNRTFSGWAAVTPGNYLVAIFGMRTGSSVSISGITDSAGNAWSQVCFGFQTGANTRVEIWSALASAAPTSLTITQSSTTVNSTLDFFELSGQSSAPIHAKTANGSGSNDATSDTTGNAGSLTVTISPTFQIFAINPATTTVTATSVNGGFNLGAIVATTPLDDAYAEVAATGTTSPVFALSGATTNGFSAVAIAPKRGGNVDLASDASVILSGTTNTKELTASALVQATATANLTASADLLATKTSDLAATALLQTTRTLSLASDALLQTSHAIDRTADALLAQAQTASLASDGLTAQTTTRDLTSDALLAFAAAASLPSDALVAQSRTANVTGDALLQTTHQSEASGSALLQITQTLDLGGAADLIATEASELAADASLIAAGLATSEVTADADLQATSTCSLAAGALLAAATAIDASADADLQATQTTSLPSDAALQETKALTLDGLALLQAAFTSELTGAGAVESTFTRDADTDALLQETHQTELDASADLLATEASELLAGALLLAAETTEATSDAVLLAAQTSSLSGSGYLIAFGESTSEADADALLFVDDQAEELGADALAAQATTSALAADADLLATQTSDLAGSALLETTRTGEINLDAVLLATSIIDLDATASLQAPAQTELAADADLLAAGTKSLGADAVLQGAVTRDCFGEGLVQATETHEATADALLLVVQSAESSADAYIVIQSVGTRDLGATAIATATETSDSSGDALVARLAASDLPVDAVVQETLQNEAAADGVLLAAQKQEMPSDAWLVATGTNVAELGSDAVVLGAVSVQIAGDGLMAQAASAQIAGDALLRTSHAADVPSDSVVMIFGRVLDAEATSIVRQTDVAEMSATGSVRASFTLDLGADAITQATTSHALAATSLIKATQMSELASEALVAETGDRDVTANAVATAMIAAEIASDAALVVASRCDLAASAALEETHRVELGADAFLLLPQTLECQSDAFLTAASSSELSADADVTATSLRETDADGVIQGRHGVARRWLRLMSQIAATPRVADPIDEASQVKAQLHAFPRVLGRRLG